MLVQRCFPAGLRGALRWTAPAVAAGVMTAISALLGAPRLLFPEGIALVLGVCVVRRPGWNRSRWRIVVAPSICALLGLLVQRLPGPHAELAVLALGGALLILMLMRSDLGPAVSAAVLPVWFGIGEWSYLALVVAFCGALAVAAPPPASEAPTTAGGTFPGRAVVVFMLCAVCWIAVVDAVGLPTVAAAPPLLVACLEFVVGGPGPGIRDGVLRWALLAAAGCLGAAAAYWIPWAWLAGTAAVAAITVLVRLCRVPLGPALALGLVPLILGRPDPVETGLAIAGGAAVLHLLPALLRSLGDRLTWAGRVLSAGRRSRQETTH